jgi:hypothetical protein
MWRKVVVGLGLVLAMPTYAGAAEHGLGHMTLRGQDSYASASGSTPTGHRIERLWLIQDTGWTVHYDYIATCTSGSGSISQRSGSGNAEVSNTRYLLPAPVKGANTCNLTVTTTLPDGGNAAVSIGYSDVASASSKPTKPKIVYTPPPKNCAATACDRINEAWSAVLACNGCTRAVHALAVAAVHGSTTPECRTARRQLTSAVKRRAVLAAATEISLACG